MRDAHFETLIKNRKTKPNLIKATKNSTETFQSTAQTLKSITILNTFPDYIPKEKTDDVLVEPRVQYPNQQPAVLFHQSHKSYP